MSRPLRIEYPGAVHHLPFAAYGRRTRSRDDAGGSACLWSAFEAPLKGSGHQAYSLGKEIRNGRSNGQRRQRRGMGLPVICRLAA